MFPHTTIYVLILLYVCHHTTLCFFHIQLSLRVFPLGGGVTHAGSEAAVEGGQGGHALGGGGMPAPKPVAQASEGQEVRLEVKVWFS